MPPIPFEGDALDQAGFLRVIQKVLPASLLEPLQQRAGTGYELYQAMAAVAARLSTAVLRVETGSYAVHAAGGAYALVELVLSRPNPGAGILIQAGTIVSDAQGRCFRLLADVDLTVADTGVGQFEACAQGWEYNLRGERVTAALETLPGLIDRFVTLVTEPAWTTDHPGIAVEQVADAAGGRAPHLDAAAEDRGLARNGGESDASLGLRARTLPDTVSPGAVLRMLHTLLDPSGIPWDFIETFEHRYQECFDAPSPNPGTPTYDGGVPPTNPDFNDQTFVLDDPRAPDIHHRNRTMDLAEYRAAFVVVVDRSYTLQHTGFALDDPGMSPADFHPAAGRPWRGTPAPDLTSLMPPDVVYPCCYDGIDFGQQALFAAVAGQLQLIRAAGVAAVVDVVRP